MIVKTTDGVELFAEIQGKGIPCLFLHGGPGYWSKSFQHFIGASLEEKLQMVYLDQRGCGRSGHSPAQHYSISRLLDDLEEVRTFFGIEEWLVMGHSFGGVLAVNYAHRFPERTKGIILSNATLHLYDSFSHQIQWGREKLGLDADSLPSDHLQAFIDQYYAILSSLLEKGEYYSSQFLDIKQKKKMDELDEGGLHSDPHFQQFVFSSEEFFQDFTVLTKHIHQPALVIAGKHDHAVGPHHHESFQFLDSKVHVLPGSHHPYMENQTDFKEAILKFVHEEVR